MSTAKGPGKRRRPNVVLIMTDDQGWGDIRSHGNPIIDTPVLDGLAQDGARFDRFFVSPVCAPTRASLLTGRYHLRTGTAWVTRGLETMRADEVTITDLFKEAGYATGCFGKWHNGGYYPYHPTGRGFEEFFGFCAGHWNLYFDTQLDHNRRTVKTQGFITDVFTDAALSFIEENREQPFFCYIPYNAPHGPFQVPDRYFGKYKERGLDDKNACIYGMCENIDDNIGRILKRLDDLKLADDTIVVFLTDNGPNGERFNGGMRGRKGSVHEGGIRVPLFIRWPGRIAPGKTVERIAAHIDLLPTLAALCNVPLPEQLELDGVSLAPLLEDTAIDWPDRMIFTHQSRRGDVQLSPGSVRTQRYRLVTEGDDWELYDMAADPSEENDIASERPTVVKELRAAYEAWFQDTTRVPIERLPIPIGYPEVPVVDLLAPECYLHGGLEYKGGMGYANDWVTNWRSTADFVSWDVDVVRDGRFEVTLMYICPEQDVGSKVRVEVGDQHLEGVVGLAHDPEPIPSFDRFIRDERYETVWAPLTLGAVDLDKGRMDLAVKALTIAGEQVIDLKAVRLRRVN